MTFPDLICFVSVANEEILLKLRLQCSTTDTVVAGHVSRPCDYLQFLVEGVKTPRERTKKDVDEARKVETDLI